MTLPLPLTCGAAPTSASEGRLHAEGRREMGLTRVVAAGTMCGADASFAKASPSSPLSSSSEHSDGAVVEPPRLLGLLEPPRSSLTEPAPLLGMLEPG